MDPALWELLSGEEEDREVAAIIRLREVDQAVPGVRLVARFGRIATCRLRSASIVDVRGHPNVVSLKAPRKLDADHAHVPLADEGTATSRDVRPTDTRIPPQDALTGAEVVVGVVDWGLDFDHPNFKHPDGTTRLLALWDQRDVASGDPPQPYGYGTVHSRRYINRALRTAQPYISLGYHPGSADRGGGSHGTHVADIAAGNGSAGGPRGVAPDAHLVFVHLADRNTGGLANLGDSVRLLEAVDFIARMAEPRPWVINLSIGRHGGPHDGTTLAELAFDELLRAATGRFIVQSTGNYYLSRTHASGKLTRGQAHTLTFVTHRADTTENELEIWYGGDDEFVVHIQPPGTPAAISVPLRHHARLTAGDQVVGRIYHRAGDPNNNDNHIDAFLNPQGRAGRWTVTLEPVRLVNGQFDAWLERADACKQCQARFTSADSDPTSTTGTIANSQLPLVVGAYDAHSPAREVAAFSSSGPTRDARIKPDLVAPGVDVLAARSAPPGSPRSSGQLVRKSGSSMAAPHVTGAAALCLQAGGHRLRAEQLRALLLATAQPAATTEDALRLGRGYLDLAALVTDVLRRSPRQIPYDRTQGTTMDTELDPIARLALAPSRAYRELMYRPHGATAQWIADRFDIVARPGQQITDRPRQGDVLLRVSLGHPKSGGCTVIDQPDTGQQRMAPGQLLLRRRTIRAGPPPIEHDFGDEADAETRTPVVVDPAAAVPAFEMTERSRIAEPLLTPRESASAVEWTSRVHPAISGVTVDEIRAALASYTDAPVVRSAIQARNQQDPAQAVDTSSPTTDAVFVECVHQFQMKCYLESREHDGRAGESTLDSLGLIARQGSGLRTADRGNATAQQRLNSRDTEVRKASARAFSAANWFTLMTDPSVFGLRTKGGRGLHVALVRKLRQAERHLLTLPAFRGMTPAALGRALGLSERHGGARPTATTTSVHTFGLAIDIAYQRNPWVRRAASWRAMRRAASLISGVNLTHASAPAYFSSLGSDPSRSTGEIWDEIQQRNAELIAYFGFAADSQALRAALDAGRARGTPGLINQGESLHAAVVRWQRDIRQDRRALTAGDFNGRKPERGFLTHPRDLAIALRDHGCLAWGAVDLGPGDRGSGDMMHYDARVDGVGRVLTQAPRAFLPTTGHPCLALASTRPAEEAASDAEAILEHVQLAAPGLLEHCAGCADAEEASTLVHTCRTGEGPPAGEPNPRGKGPHPTIRRGTTPAQSRRPSVGWAQLSLNRWIEQHAGGTHQCPATSAEAQQYVRRQLDALRAESQLPLAVDCRFGPSTQRAVRAFQECMGIGRDGIVGPVTWPLLKRFEGPTGPPVQPTVTPPVTGIDLAIEPGNFLVAVAKPHTRPGRVRLVLRASASFSESAILTRTSAAPGPTIRLFTAATGGSELAFDGRDNVFSGARLAGGVELFADGVAASPTPADFTLTLAPHLISMPGSPGVARGTAVAVTLDVGLTRVASGGDPLIIPEPDRIATGRAVQVADATRTHERALLIIRPPVPAGVAVTLVVAPRDARVRLFTQETPSDSDAPLTTPREIPATSVPTDGVRLFAEAVSVSLASRDTGVCLGIKDVAAEVDRVDMTAVQVDAVEQAAATAPPLTFVRFGLWDEAYAANGNVRNGNAEVANFIGRDRRKFHLRVSDPAVTGDSVNADWRTLHADGTTNDDSPANQRITLPALAAGGREFVSRAVMLVTDETDRNFPTNSGLTVPFDAGNRAAGDSNHRTRRARLDGFTRVEYSPQPGVRLGTRLPVFRRGANDERRRIPVRVVRYTNPANSGFAVAPAARIADHFANANACWNAVGIRIDPDATQDRAIPPAALDASGLYGGVANNGNEQAALLDLIPDAPDGALTVVFVSKSGANAYATIGERTPIPVHGGAPLTIGDRYFIFVSATVDPVGDTLGHELHHVLFNRFDVAPGNCGSIASAVRREFFTFNTCNSASYGLPLPDVRVRRRVHNRHSPDPNADPANANVVNWARRARTVRHPLIGKNLDPAADATTGNTFNQPL